jgi:hypothetical protein
MYEVFNNILKIYNDTKSKTESWTKISDIISSSDNIFKATYNKLLLTPLENIYLDYQININNITLDGNEIDNYVTIISALHKIIYELLIAEGNHYFSLNGQEEMVILQTLDKPLKYYVHISIKNEQNVYFHAFIWLFALEALFQKPTYNFYLGIDFEFTNHKIQLVQLNFEHSSSLNNIIMIVNPDELETNVFNTFVDNIMCNHKIKKIMHGADSQDMPYMFEGLFKQNNKKIVKFMKTMIDTRFLCEYYKINYDQGDSCSVYSMEPERSAVFYFGVVSAEKQKQLEHIIEDMPHSADMPWYIHKMSKQRILYAQYDVLFLKYLYFRMIYKISRTSDFEPDQKKLIRFVKKTFFELSQFIYLEKKGITTLLNQCKLEVDPINNYMIKTKNNTYKLIDIFKNNIVDLKSIDPEFDVDKLLKIKMFSTSITLLLKKLTYTVISKKHKIMMNKDKQWRDKLDNEYIFDFFEDMKFTDLKIVFKNVESNIIAIVNSLN